MKKVFVFIILVLISSGCNQHKQGLALRISKRIESQSQSLDFSVIAPFEWDRVFFFPPYTPESTIRQVVGGPWEEYKKSKMGISDAYILILFKNKEAVVGWCMFPRGIAEFASLYHSRDNLKGYTRAEATFTVEYTGSAKNPTIRKK